MRSPLFLYDFPLLFLVSLNVFQYLITKESQTRQVGNQNARDDHNTVNPEENPKEGYEDNGVEITLCLMQVLPLPTEGLNTVLGFQKHTMFLVQEFQRVANKVG